MQFNQNFLHNYYQNHNFNKPDLNKSIDHFMNFTFNCFTFEFNFRYVKQLLTTGHKPFD